MPNLIGLEANGKIYTNFESYSIEKGIETLCGTFALTVSASDSFGNIPIAPNESIVISIDGEPVITGYAEELSVSYGDGSHTVRIIGRDKTCDFVDSTLESKTFTPPIGFVELLKKLLTLVGYEVVNKFTRIGLTAVSNKISIINNYGTIAQFTTAEGIQLKHSESAYNLIKRCAEKRQLVLNSDGNGNIVINDIGAERAVTILQNVKAEPNNNNIKNASVRYSFQDRYHSYKIKSMTTQGNQTSSGASNAAGSDVIINSISTTPQVGSATDPEILRPTRKYTAIGSTAMTSSDCKNRAKWEANIRKARGFSYSCEVTGFRQNLNEIGSLGFSANPLWKPNQLVYVFDEFAGIDDELLIKSVNYTQDLNGGSITKLELVDKQAYSYSIFESPLKRRKNGKISQQTLFAT